MSLLTKTQPATETDAEQYRVDIETPATCVIAAPVTKRVNVNHLVFYRQPDMSMGWFMEDDADDELEPIELLDAMRLVVRDGGDTDVLHFMIARAFYDVSSGGKFLHTLMEAGQSDSIRSLRINFRTFYGEFAQMLLFFGIDPDKTHNVDHIEIDPSPLYEESND